ncbi:MAG: hypothetical protein GC186_16305 [Rhodobacteraceae bacterium]|nr:hypothetical protein [Paracoccaceae bacterium]
MRVPIVLLFLSSAIAALSLAAHGPVASGPLLVALVGLLIGALLLARALRARRKLWIVVDGSNVLHWHPTGPRLEAVTAVVAELSRRGFAPVVWFDANAGYLVANRYLGPAPFARLLGLPERQVYVAPKGTPADPLLLHGANLLGARVVTNDRFRDWAAAHPRVTEPGYLIRGRVEGERVVLDGVG